MAQYSNLNEKPLKQAVKNSQDDNDMGEIAINNFFQENIFDQLEDVYVAETKAGSKIDRVHGIDIIFKISNMYFDLAYGKLPWIHDTRRPRHNIQNFKYVF